MTINEFKRKYDFDFKENTPTYQVLLEIASEFNNLPERDMDPHELTREGICEDFMSLQSNERR